MFNVCINIWLISYIDSLDFFSKLFAKKIFGRFAQSYLVNFKELFHFRLSPYSSHFQKTFTFCKWKGRSLGQNLFALSRTFLSFFYFFQKSFFKELSSQTQKANLSNLKRPPIKPTHLSLVNSFFYFFWKNFKKVKSLSKNDFQIADRIPFWKLWFSSCIIFFQLQALFLKKFYIIY